MDTDQAITKMVDEKFGRKSFVKALANSLCLPKGSGGFVVGIEGKWGTGKSSIINLVEEYLDENTKEALVVRFAPWLISDLESICEGFLVQLAAQIGSIPNSDTGKRAAKNVLNFAKFLTPIKFIPGAEPWFSIIQGVIESVGKSTEAAAKIAELDLGKRKKKVEKSLDELDRPILIIIDDIDRLRPNEIRTVFRFVKAVGDFKRVAYLLAYDPDPVHEALSEGNLYNGKDYKEKIVQVSYPLPVLTYMQVKRYLVDKINEFIKTYKIKLADYEEDRLTEGIKKILAHAIRRPRDVSLLLNRMRISALSTPGEVNFVDVLLFEALSIRFEGVVKVIRARPFDFTFINASKYHESMFSDYSFYWDLDPEYRETWKERLWENLEEQNKRLLFSFIDFLFPAFRGRGEGHPPENPNGERRICSLEPLMTLLSIGQIEGAYSAVKAKSFLTSIENRQAIIDEYIEAKEAGGWLTELAYHVSVTKVENPHELCDLAYQAVLKTYKLHKKSIVDSAHKFLRNLLRQVCRNNQITEKLYLKISECTSCLSLSECIVLDMVLEHGKFKTSPGSKIAVEQRTIADWNVVYTGVNNWLNKVMEKSKDPEVFLNEPEIISVLFRWGQLKENFDDVHNFTATLTANNDGVVKFLNIYTDGKKMIGIDSLFKDWEAFSKKVEVLPDKSGVNKKVFHKILGNREAQPEERSK